MTEQGKLQNSTSTDLIVASDLDPQLKRFAFEYIATYKHREAASKAGFNPNRGISLLRNPEVKEFIDSLEGRLADSSLIRRDLLAIELLDTALPVAKGEISAPAWHPEQGHFDKTEFQPTFYMKALDMIAKHTGFTQNEKEAGGVVININLDAVGVTIDGQKA